MATTKPYIGVTVAKKTANTLAKAAWERFVEKCTPYQKKKLGTFPKIVWEKRGFRIAGEANLTDNVISMNINYLYSSDANRFVTETIIHELAHIVAYRVYNSGGHDAKWRNTCLWLGGNGVRCHEYKTPINKPGYTTMKVFKCTCGVQFEFTEKQAKKYLGGEYRCHKCHRNLDTVREV